MMGDGSALERALGKDKTKVGEGLSLYTVNGAEVGRVIVEGDGQDGWFNKSPTVGW